METSDATQAGCPRAIDLSSAILVRRYLTFWQRVFSATFLVSLISFVLHPSVFGLVLVVGTVLGYRIVRYPRRWLIRCWNWLWFVAVSIAGVWLVWRFLVILRDEFTVGLLVPLGDICLFFWVCTRMLRESGIVEEEAAADTSQLFASGPSFVERWLSGGWRTLFILSMVWSLSFYTGPWSLVEYKPKIGLACILFILVLSCAMVIPWALIPVRRALQEDSAMNLVRAVQRNRLRTPGGSYTSFLLRNAPGSGSVPWLVASVLLVLGATLSLLLIPSYSPQALSEEVSDREFLYSMAGLMKGLTAAALVSLSLFCWRRARQEILRGTLNMDFPGGRPATLYLRSFADDQVKVLRDGLRYRVWLVDPFLANIRFTRFEQVVADAIWPFGGLIGLARPGEELPELGAMRIAADDRDWKEKIARLMDECQYILMVVGLTSGLKWEFEQSHTKSRLAKLSLVIPPEKASSAIRSWRALVSDCPPLFLCDEQVLACAIAVRFQDDTSPVFFLAKTRSVAAYRMALEACWLPMDDLPGVVGISAVQECATAIPRA